MCERERERAREADRQIHRKRQTGVRGKEKQMKKGILLKADYQGHREREREKNTV